MNKQKEIWRCVSGYEDYKVSNMGKVNSYKFGKVKQLAANTNGCGYAMVGLYKYGSLKRFCIHQLVAIEFMEHKPNGYELVVDHIDNNKLNNNSSNLQIITQRENTIKVPRGESKYVGVDFYKPTGKWRARIVINKKRISLGCFKNEIDAHNAFQDKLKSI